MSDTGTKAGLFASVLDARARQAEARARILKWLPLVVALHVLALLGVAHSRRDPTRLARANSDDAAPVLRLLPAPPPPASASATSPSSGVTRKTIARRVLRRPQPRAVPREPEPLPSEEEAPPAPFDVSAPATLGALPGGTAGGVAGGVLGGVVGGLVQAGLARGGLGDAFTVSPDLTPEEREAWVARYLEALIRSRFMHVRYPHQAAAAGITGQVVLRVSIGARGQLLNLELLGRCPHPVLCDAAKETVINARPFPPPPPELGSPFLLELPFRYHLR